MIKILNVGNKEVSFKCSAALPRVYRNLFHKDMITEMSAWDNISEEEIQIPPEMEETLENVAFAMAKLADPSLKEDVFEWLDSFNDPFAIENILPEILNMWLTDFEPTSDAKKNTSD